MFEELLSSISSGINNCLSICWNWMVKKWVEYVLIPQKSKHNLHMSTRVFNLHRFVYFLSSNIIFSCNSLLDMAAVDYYFKRVRFKIIYQLISVNPHSSRTFISNFTYDKSKNFHLTLSNIFNNAIWFERECWDMFGIFFIGNVALRRILTDYGFKNHPLRKEFPLTGYIEVYFDLSRFMITYCPVTLSQELRFFNFNSSWEGIERW